MSFSSSNLENTITSGSNSSCSWYVKSGVLALLLLIVLVIGLAIPVIFREWNADNLQKFLDCNESFLASEDGFGTPYFIKRQSLVDKLIKDILSCVHASTVVNILGMCVDCIFIYFICNAYKIQFLKNNSQEIHWKEYIGEDSCKANCIK